MYVQSTALEVIPAQHQNLPNAEFSKISTKHEYFCYVMNMYYNEAKLNIIILYSYIKQY